MRKFGHVFVELYGFDVYFIRCSRAVYAKKIEHEFDLKAPIKPDNAATCEVYAKERRQIGVIWLCPSADRSHLTHEVFHTVHFFLDDRGMRLTNDSDEAYAYLIQYLFRKMEPVMFRGRK